MHRPYDSALVNSYFHHLAAAVRLFGADSCAERAKLERLKGVLLEHGGAPPLAAVSEVTGPDRVYEPVFGVLSAIWGLHLADAPHGDFGGLCRAVAAKIGLASGETNLLTRSFGQIVEAADPVVVAHAIVPLARRALEEGLRCPWQSIFRDLLNWGPDVKNAWLKSFRGNAPAPAKAATRPEPAAAQRTQGKKPARRH